MFLRLTLTQNITCILTEEQLPHGFPTIDMGPQLKVVERTRTATMLCAASGNPDPEITWFKDFLPVDTSNSNGRIKQLRSGRTFLYQLSISIKQLGYMWVNILTTAAVVRYFCNCICYSNHWWILILRRYQPLSHP